MTRRAAECYTPNSVLLHRSDCVLALRLPVASDQRDSEAHCCPGPGDDSVLPRLPTMRAKLRAGSSPMIGKPIPYWLGLITLHQRTFDL